MGRLHKQRKIKRVGHMTKDGIWVGVTKKKKGKRVLYNDPIRGNGSDDEVEKIPKKPKKKKGKPANPASNDITDEIDASKSFELQEVPENAELPDLNKPEQFVPLPNAPADYGSKTAAKRKKYFKEQKEKKKQKKQAADQHQQNQKKTFGRLKDHVRFGEQAAAPPRFSSVPKSKKQSSGSAKQRQPSISNPEAGANPSAVEAIRQHVIAQYRKLKQQNANKLAPPNVGQNPELKFM